jgi:hypothetical protein
MGGRSRLAGSVHGRCLTLLAPDAAAAAVVCVAGGTDAAAQVKRAVRLRVGKSHGRAAGQKSQPADTSHRHSEGCGQAHGRPAGVRLRRRSGGWSAWWGGRAGVRRGARLTSVPADRLSSRSRTSRGRDRRRLNIAVRLRVGKSQGRADRQRAQRDAEHADNAATGVRGGVARRRPVLGSWGRAAGAVSAVGPA